MHREGRPVRRTIPIDLIIDSRSVLVVGGGQVGLRKTKSLLEAGATVELICPDAIEPLLELVRAGSVVHTCREWRTGDAAGHLAVFACTDDKHVNRAVLDDARTARVPCCCADMNWCDGDFTTPAVTRAGGMTVAVSTGGQSCVAARDFKNEVAAMLEERRNLELLVIGTCDALLSSRKRSPYHLPAEERAVLGPLVSHVRGVREFFILNTCNRVELVAVVAHDERVPAVLERLVGLDRLAPGERFRLTGFEAFRHLVRVTAGMESSLLGEFHVVSQMKDALEEAERNGWSSSALRFTGAEVMRVQKIVRHAVEGMLRIAEIDQIAVRYLGVHGGIDADTRIMVIGTGMVGRGVVAALAKSGCHITWVYHVSVPDAAGIGAAGAVDRVVPMAAIGAELAEADIVVSAVDSSKSVVTPAMAPAAEGRNVLFVDLGVPRNVDPFYDDWGHGVTVADLDDLKLWHRVKTGTLEKVLSVADATIRDEYRAMY